MMEPVQTSGAAMAGATAVTLATTPAMAGMGDISLTLVLCATIGGLVGMVISEPKQPPLEGWPLVKHSTGWLFAATVIGTVFNGMVLPVADDYWLALRDIENLPMTQPAMAIILGMLTTTFNAWRPLVAAPIKRIFGGGA